MPQRGFHPQSEVRAVEVVVLEELAERPMEVSPTQDDDLLREFAPHGADEALGNAVLPRAPVAGTNGLNAHRPE